MTEGELLIIFGPPAVGKMTVGRAICARSGFRLFHNHLTIEPLLEVFDYGTPPFNTLNDEFRRRLMQEAAASGTRLVFTFVWGVDLASDADIVRSYLEPFLAAGLPVAFVELTSDLQTRLLRDAGEDRIAAKPSKRDRALSEGIVRSLEQYRLNTDPGEPSLADAVLAHHRHLRIDTTHLSADETAQQILGWLGR